MLILNCRLLSKVLNPQERELSRVLNPKVRELSRVLNIKGIDLSRVQHPRYMELSRVLNPKYRELSMVLNPNIGSCPWCCLSSFLNQDKSYYCNGKNKTLGHFTTEFKSSSNPDLFLEDHDHTRKTNCMSSRMLMTVYSFLKSQ